MVYCLNKMQVCSMDQKMKRKVKIRLIKNKMTNR